MKLKAIWTPEGEQTLCAIRTLMFDTHANSPDYLMTVNNLSVGLNMPAALQSRTAGGQEIAHGLPPYRPRRAYLVDEYPACPENWMRSSGRVKSYFVAIKEGTGLWLDFNQCWNHPSHVAIVISVQGINAITGLPCKDPQLEQYRDECPKHKKAFGPDRLCAECGFHWPRQNYLPSSTTPHGHLWLDGFRAKDGQVRQYVFTAQEMRGVAAAIIGKDRVFALGISYFLAKQPKPPQTSSFQSRGWQAADESQIGSDMLSFSGGTKGIACASGPSAMYCCSSVDSVDMDATSMNKLMDGGDTKGGPISASPKISMSKTLGSKGVTGPKGPKGPAGRLMSPGVPVHEADYSAIRSVAVKQLEVAAGARIDQSVADDTCDLDYYQKEPDGLVVINYCTEEDAEKIIKAGKVDVAGTPEGFMAKVPVGNP